MTTVPIGPRIVSRNGIPDYGPAPRPDPVPPRRRSLIRFFRLCLRALNRRRHSREIASVRSAAAAELRVLSENLDRRNNELHELRQRLENRDLTIRLMRDEEIPRLECRIAVQQHELELLSLLRERELTRIEADVASHKRRETEAEVWQGAVMKGALSRQ